MDKAVSRYDSRTKTSQRDLALDIAATLQARLPDVMSITDLYEGNNNWCVLIVGPPDMIRKRMPPGFAIALPNNDLRFTTRVSFIP